MRAFCARLLFFGLCVGVLLVCVLRCSDTAVLTFQSGCCCAAWCWAVCFLLKLASARCEVDAICVLGTRLIRFQIAGIEWKEADVILTELPGMMEGHAITHETWYARSAKVPQLAPPTR